VELHLIEWHSRDVLEEIRKVEVYLCLDKMRLGQLLTSGIDDNPNETKALCIRIEEHRESLR